MKNGRSRRQRGKIIKPYFNEETAPYGNFHVEGGRTGRVHVFVCLAFNGETPAGKPYCCHKDGDRLNSTPNNLYWGSAKQNQEDRKRHATSPCGENHANAVLSQADVIDIRTALQSGEKQKDIAARYGVTQPQISNIKHGRRWAHG